MQKQTSGQQPLVYFLLVVTFLFGCTSKNEDFSYAISQHQDTSLTRLPEIVSGLPFYSPKTLSPFWAEESDPKEMVSIPKFELRDQNDKRVSEKLFSRKNTIVGFVFTSCSGFCPTLVEKMKKIKSKVNNKNFQYVFFTVDPEVDTPGVLKKYMKKHYVKGQNWTFITGDKKTIYQLIKNTFASEVRQLESANMRKFAHTEHFYVIDQKSRLRAILNGTRIDLPQNMLKVVSQL